MKKIIVSLLLILAMLFLVSCKQKTDQDPSDNTPPTNSEETEETLGNNDGEGDKTDDTVEDGKGVIEIIKAIGLNEQILVRLADKEGFLYSVYYKLDEDKEFTLLDSELIVKSDEGIECYLLGLETGKYAIKVRAEYEGKTYEKTVKDIRVLPQDRSGYAHFNSEDGVGAYNNDGTLKDGTNVIYVTNENKNTVTLNIGGTEYVGLVNILQAQYKSDTPLLVRIIGSIKTNQWNEKNLAPRLADGSNAVDNYFENSFSNEYGENLANLIVKFKDNGSGKTYNYRTTVNGLGDVRITNGGTATNIYKGSDYPELYGKTVFDDDSYYNMIEVKGSKNITIEGVGSNAEIFQFGISFEECNSVEIKNLTFTGYPEDALNFLGDSRSMLANFGRYWIHSCTFNRGNNTWDLSGERDKYAGDGSIDFNNVSNVTLAYNLFNNTKKSMLFGSSDSQACMNFTMHHNNFFKVESRLPLGRNVNIHSYNNYFNQCKNGMDIRKNSYIFSENNYFKSTSKPFIVTSSIVKSFGDVFVSSSSSGIKVVTDRTKTLANNCKPDGKIDCSKFDTNPELFYYDAEKCKTIASVMLPASDIPKFVSTYAGAGIFVQIAVTQ